MELEDFFPVAPNPESSQFPLEISRKAEFLDRKSVPVELLEQEGKQFFNAQEVIYMVGSLGLNFIFLYWEPGAGKTCAYECLVRYFRKMQREAETFDAAPYKRAFIFESSNMLLKEIKKQILCNCSDPDDFNKAKYASKKLSQVQWNKAMDRELAKFYTFTTYKKESLKLETMTDNEIREKYNNSILLLDEFHNVKSEIWSQFFRVTHTAVNVKIVVSSGTPIGKEPGEIVRIMNVGLPLDKQMPYDPNDLIFRKSTRKKKDPTTGITTIKNAYQVYMDICGYTSKDQIPKKDYTKISIQELSKYISGHISYLRKPDTGMDPVNLSSTIALKDDTSSDVEVKTTVHPVFMSEFQTRVYSKHFDDAKGNRGTPSMETLLGQSVPTDAGGIKPFYNNERQASNLVYPDGSIGKKGFEKYVSAPPKQKRGKRMVSIGNYAATPKFREAITGENLKQYSAKTYEELKICKQNWGMKGFIYDDYVTDSGVIVKGIIFAENGYDLLVPTKDMFIADGAPKSKFGGTCGASGTNNLIPNMVDKPRIAVIHSKVPAAKVSMIMDLYNCEANATGKYLQVVIGSPAMKEGFSLMEAFFVIITSSRWTVATLYQIINRVNRVNSHLKTLSKLRVENPNARGVIHIYKLAAVPDPKFISSSNAESEQELLDVAYKASIDIGIYLGAVRRENDTIERMKEMLKRCSFDLILNYERNIFVERIDARIAGKEASEFTLYPWNINKIEPQDVDYSTYDSLFVETRVKRTISFISQLFLKKSEFTFEELSRATRETRKLLSRALAQMIFEKVKVKDRFSRDMYVYETGKVYWLAPIAEKEPTLDSIIYNKTLPVYEQVEEKVQVSLSEIDPDMSIDDLIRFPIPKIISIFETALMEYVTNSRQELLPLINGPFKGYWTVIPEPVTMINYYTANPGAKPQITYNPQTKARIVERVDTTSTFYVDYGQTPVYIHYLDLLEKGNSYTATTSYEKFECEIRVLKLGDPRGWRKLVGSEERAYNAFLQMKSSMFRNHLRHNIRLYGTLASMLSTKLSFEETVDSGFRIVDARRDSEARNQKEISKGAIAKNKNKNELIDCFHFHSILPSFPITIPPSIINQTAISFSSQDEFMNWLSVLRQHVAYAQSQDPSFDITRAIRVGSITPITPLAYKGSDWLGYAAWCAAWQGINMRKDDLARLLYNDLAAKGFVEQLGYVPETLPPASG